MTAVFIAALFYFGVAFAAGFALGAARTLILAPQLGETGAVLAELPFMLAISWFACSAAIERFRIPRKAGPRLVMGAAAFGFLMTAEIALASILFDRTIAAQAETWTSTPGMIGLAGQIAFAMFPLLQTLAKKTG